MKQGQPKRIRFGVAGFVALFVLLVSFAAQPVRAGGTILSADEAFARSQSGDIIIVDVRSPYEWRQTGLPAGAKRATVHNPQGLNAFLKEIDTIMGNSRDKAIALICARGWRSAAAASFLHGKGYTNVFDVREGMLGRDDLPGWIKRELPVESCDDC